MTAYLRASPVQRDAPLAAQHRRLDFAVLRLTLSHVADCLSPRCSGGSAWLTVGLPDQAPSAISNLLQHYKARSSGRGAAFFLFHLAQMMADGSSDEMLAAGLGIGARAAPGSVPPS